MQKIESHHISLDIRKLSIPENPINPESWTKMENNLMNIYSSFFGGCESKRICDVCEKMLDLTTKDVDYTCNECGFRLDICNDLNNLKKFDSNNILLINNKFHRFPCIL